jgi:uncharacterized protein YkwD
MTIKKLLTINGVLILMLMAFAACDSSTDSGGDAAPLNPPSSDTGQTPSDEPLNDFQAEMLDLVNEARAQGRDCGNTFYPAAPSVSWDTRIEDAALGHSLDMAEIGELVHIGSDGSDPGDRLLMEGYEWVTYGENILVGLDQGENVINNWINSPGHCTILMNPAYEDVGVGAAEGLFQGETEIYWTLDLGTENN